MDKEQAEYSRQRIFELALNIARLQFHGAVLDNDGKLNLLSGDSVEAEIDFLRGTLEQEAKSILLHGGWELL